MFNRLESFRALQEVFKLGYYVTLSARGDTDQVSVERRSITIPRAGAGGLPEEVQPDMLQDDEFLQAFHHALLEVPPRPMAYYAASSFPLHMLIPTSRAAKLPGKEAGVKQALRCPLARDQNERHVVQHRTAVSDVIPTPTARKLLQMRRPSVPTACGASAMQPC